MLLDCQACCCCHPKRSMACYSWDGQVFYTLEDTTNLFVWNDNCTPIDWSIVLSQVRTAQGKIWSRRTPQRVCRCTNLAGYATLVPLWPNLKIIILNLAKYLVLLTCTAWKMSWWNANLRRCEDKIQAFDIDALNVVNLSVVLIFLFFINIQQIGF